MKYCRFSSPEGPQYGLIETIASAEQITHILPMTNGMPDLSNRRSITPLPLASAALLAPVQPSKIVCIGRNYADHAKELGNAVPTDILIFLKPPSSIIGPQEKIRRPGISQRIDFEGELAVIIGKHCCNIRPDEGVRPFILGYTCANDVTARDLQKTDDQWTRAKGFDTFCPVGPLVTDEIDPWVGLRLETRLNGAVKQSATTLDFIFPLDAVVRYISGIMTLVPGDLILTGTPAGIAPMAAGDVVEVSILGIGTLRNPVVDAD